MRVFLVWSEGASEVVNTEMCRVDVTDNSDEGFKSPLGLEAFQDCIPASEKVGQCTRKVIENVRGTRISGYCEGICRCDLAKACLIQLGEWFKGKLYSPVNTCLHTSR